MTLFHEPKLIQWVHAPGFRGLVGLSTSRRKHKIFAVEITRLDQNEKEDDSLNFFKEHK